MSTTVVQIQILDSSLNPTNTINFIEQEVLNCLPLPLQRSVVQRAQTGKPQQYIVGDAWHQIPISFRVHSQDTTSKLGTIRNNARNGSLMRVYPNLLDDPTLFFDCLTSPEIPLFPLFSGGLVVGETIDLIFIEATKDGYVYVGEDIYA